MLQLKVFVTLLAAVAIAQPHSKEQLTARQIAVDDDLVDGVDQGTQLTGITLGQTTGSGVGVNNTAGNNNGNGNEIGNGNTLNLACGNCAGGGSDDHSPLMPWTDSRTNRTFMLRVRQVLPPTLLPTSVLPENPLASAEAGVQGSPENPQSGVINISLECC